MAHLKQILDSNHEALHHLIAKVNQLQKWNNYLLSSIPSEKQLFEHCHIVRMEGDTLIIIADNAHWATRFKLLMQPILVSIRKYPDFKHIQNIFCKIRPPLYKNEKENIVDRAPISAESSAMLLDAAEKVEDVKLGDILKKLAGRTE